MSAITTQKDRVVIRSAEPETIDAVLTGDPLGWPIVIGADRRVSIECAAARTPIARHG